LPRAEGAPQRAGDVVSSSPGSASTWRPSFTESESPLTFREFLFTLWRRKLTIVVSIVVAVVAALAYSKVQTPKYQSTALVQESTVTASGSTTQTNPVTLPDPVQQLESTAVQIRAAKLLGDANLSTVAHDVTGTADPTTGALTITATDANAARAQAVAKAYSQAFVDQTQALVQAQMDKITSALNQLKTQISGLQGQTGSATNAVIQAQITAATNSYSSLQSQLNTIQFGEPYSSIQIAAGLPVTPTGLSKSKLLAIGFVAGLLAGCGIALARDQFDTRLRSSPELLSVTDAPILAELPQDGEVRSGTVAIALVQAPQSQMAESIRELRTSIRVILHDTPSPVIVVTSPEAGDGKTFVTANLAAAWAMSGSKVIVISADFRRPRLEEVFGLPTGGSPGLSDLIRSNWKREPDRQPVAPAEEEQVDQSSVSSLLLDTGIVGLQLLPAGTQLDHPSELFGSPGMRPVLDQLPLLADVILVDTPPVLAAPDTAIIGSMAFGSLVVAAEGKTDRVDLERTVRRLETTHCRVLGVALNRVRRSSSDSYQYYAYKR